MRFADAHIHLFREGYRRPGLPSRGALRLAGR